MNLEQYIKNKKEDTIKLQKEVWNTNSPKISIPNTQPNIDNSTHITCLHSLCSMCKGTGKKKDRTFCFHFLSCPCPKCSIQM